MKFLSDLFSKEEADVVVCGIPLGKGSADSLESLRRVSRYVEPFDLIKKRNLLENVKVADAGDVKLNTPDEITRAVADIRSHNKIPLLLGGGHLLTLFALKSLKNVKVIVFDAHCDMKDEYIDGKIAKSDSIPFMKKEERLRFNGATWLRRYCEFVSPKNVALVGVRSCDEDELSFMESNSVLHFTPNQIRDDIKNVKTRLEKFVGRSPLYISLDLDVFEPSIAPAVDHPEPDGLMFHQFVEVLDALENKQMMGMDVCCLRTITGNEMTEFLATKAVLEMFGLLKIRSI